MQDFYKKHRRYLLIGAMMLAVFVLSACARQQLEPITPESEGFWDSYIIYPLSQLILWLSHTFNSYGIGIIIFTLIGRVILLPLTIYQQKNMEKMNDIQPEIKALQEKYSSRDEATQMKLQEEMKRVQQEAGVSNWSGCLPILIQMPIFIALYQTVLRTPELATGNFLWMELGQPDPYFIIPIMAAGFTLLNTVLMQYGREQQGSKMMYVIMPVMIFLITIATASSIAIYFAVTNLTSVLTTLIFSNPFKKKREREEAEARAIEKEKRRKAAIKKAKKLGRSVKK